MEGSQAWGPLWVGDGVIGPKGQSRPQGEDCSCSQMSKGWARTLLAQPGSLQGEEENFRCCGAQRGRAGGRQGLECQEESAMWGKLRQEQVSGGVMFGT